MFDKEPTGEGASSNVWRAVYKDFHHRNDQFLMLKEIIRDHYTMGRLQRRVLHSFYDLVKELTIPFTAGNKRGNNLGDL